MGIVADVMDALDRIPIWKKLGEVPAALDVLTGRVETLEAMLAGKVPGEVCRACGGRGLRLKRTYGPDKNGNMREVWGCEACPNQEERAVRPTVAKR
jgi:hypothetical protein